jgi:hypothetical protein
MKKYVCLLIITALLSWTQLFSQLKTIDRKYIPIIIANHQAPLLNINYREWQAYRYNAGANQWSAVPFQVDEVDPQGKYNKEEEIDGKIDANDELLLMPEDLGDKAPQWKWIPASPVEENRIELEISDPLSDHTKTGWVYLFKNVNPVPTITGYISRSLPPTQFPAADTVNSNSYRIGHNKEGWIDFVSLSMASDRDLVDRLKMRLAGGSLLFSDFAITEENLVAQKDSPKGPVTFIEGKIRAFHNERGELISPFGGPNFKPADYPLQYFPYSMSIGIANFGISEGMLSLIGLKTMRQSIDFSEAAVGMKFYSAANPEGISIDGHADSPNITMDQNTPVIWVMASGDAGTVLLLITNPKIENAATQIYYRDNSSGTNDNTPDTGDLKSFGDMGMWVNAASGSLKTKSLTIGFTAYFINEANLDASFGAQILTWTENPLVLSAVEQPYLNSSVENMQSAPSGFYLYPARPNPYKQGEGNIQFDFSVKSPGQNVECVIYNMLGQKVAQIEKTITRTSQNSLLWNGLDDRGQAVPAGLYLVRVQTGPEGMTRKFMLLH